MNFARYSIYTLILIILPLTIFAQKENALNSTIQKLKINQKKIHRFSIPAIEQGRNQIVLEVPFAKANILNPIHAAAAEGKVIEKVQLVFTTYKNQPDFNQQKLNYNRLINLSLFLPDVFSNVMTEWELIEQDGARDNKDGEKYFHGFIITWRPTPSTSTVLNELKILDSIFLPILSTKEKLSFTPKLEISKNTDRRLTYSDGSTTILNRNIGEDSLWMHLKSENPNFTVVTAKWSDTAHTIISVVEQNFDGYKIKRQRKLEEYWVDTPLIKTDKIYLNNPDSVVSTVMRRNNWNHIVLVTDVTGSMSPYIAQVLALIPYELAARKCDGFVFFNDGNSNNSNNKKIGNTGGIYGIQTQHFDSVYWLMKNTMMAGNGGDVPENPLEATIYSIKKFPDAKEIILIADNFSPPRDLELFSKINRSIHIILCSARGIINPDYLFLARQTKGTLHTVHDDILNLSNMQEDEIIIIEGKHYILKNEHFLCLDTL
jgi:hypothetical protein